MYKSKINRRSFLKGAAAVPLAAKVIVEEKTQLNEPVYYERTRNPVTTAFTGVPLRSTKP